MSSDLSEVGGCEITQTFGTDALGSLHLARHASSGKTVLLRVLSESVCADASYRDRFLLEAKSAARLEHENIARLLQAGGAGSRLFFASEFHGGESLLSMVRRRARSEATSLKIALCIADALRFAWNKEQLVHRGLSLANVIIGEDGIVRLYELGMAKPSDGVFADVRFAAPEQLMGRAATDHRLDMFSLGMILHSLITGQLPPAVTIPAAIKLTDPRLLNPNLTVASCRILEKLLAREPANRYRSWEDVLRDIRRALRGEDAQTQPPPAGNSVLVFNTPLPPVAVNQAVAAAAEPAVVELTPSPAQSKPAAPAPPAAGAQPPPAAPSLFKKHATTILLAATAVVVVITAVALWRHFTYDPLDELIRSRKPPADQKKKANTPPTEPQPPKPDPKTVEAPTPPTPPPPPPEPPVAKDPAKEFSNIRAFTDSNPNAHAELIEKLRRFVEEFPEAPQIGAARILLQTAEAKLAAAQAQEQRQRDEEEARQRADAQRLEREAREQEALRVQREQLTARAKEALPKFIEQFHAALTERKFDAALSLARQQLEHPDFESLKPQLSACANAAERLKKFWDDLPVQLSRLKKRSVTVQGVTGTIGDVSGHDVTLEHDNGSVGIALAEASTADVLTLASLFLAADAPEALLTRAWFCFADGKHAEAGAFLDLAQKAGATANDDRETMGLLSARFPEADAERCVAQFRATIAAQDWRGARWYLDLLKARYAQTRAWQASQKDIAATEGILTYYENLTQLPAASVLRVFQHPAPVTAVAFHPHGRHVASASQNIVRLWDLVTAQLTREIDTKFAGGISLLAIPSHGRFVVAASNDAPAQVKIVEISSGREIARYSPNANKLAVCPQGRFLFGVVDGYPKLWHLETGEPVKEYGGSPWGVQMGQFTPNGQQLVSALRVNDPVVRWQDLPNGKVAAELKTIQLPISTMALTADGKTLIAVTNDGAFKVCKRDAPDEPRSFGDGVNTHAGLALSSDGRYVAAAVEGGKIKLWNVATGRAIRLFQGHSAPVRAVAYSPDQRFIASGSEDKTLRVWKLWDGDSLPPAPKPTASAPR